jgi:hypothetical protein
MRLTVSAVVLSAAMLAPVAAVAQTTPILRSDIRAATAPNYGCDGWDYSQQGLWWTMSLIPGGSPSGNDSLRIRALPTNDAGNRGWGCRFAQTMEPSPPQGSVRYARWRIKYISPVNWRSDSCAVPPCTANNRTTPDKLFILGNTCEAAPHQPTRIIYWQNAAAPSRSQPLNILSQNIGQTGPPSGGQTGFFSVPIDTWLNIQIRIESSSTTTAFDGRLSAWVNNNNIAAPTVATPRDTQIRTSGWGRNTCSASHIVWGDGSYNPLTDDDSTANAVQEIADFEYDDAFDPNWAIGVPGAPTNLRVIPGGENLALLPLGVLGVVLLRRRKPIN